MSILAVREIVADYILIVNAVHEFLWIFQSKFPKSLLCRFDPGACCQHLTELFEFRFRYLAVLDAILLIVHIGAHEAMFASDAVLQKETVTAVFAVLKIGAVVAVHTIDAMIQEFPRPDAIAFHAAFRSVNAVAVITVAIVF